MAVAQPQVIDTPVPENAWTAIKYPQALWDDLLDLDAEVAENSYAAFTSKVKDLHVTARPIVR